MKAPPPPRSERPPDRERRRAESIGNLILLGYCVLVFGGVTALVGACIWTGWGA